MTAAEKSVSACFGEKWGHCDAILKETADHLAKKVKRWPARKGV